MALAVLVFALAVCVDSFLVGLAYGLGKIKLPWLSRLIVVSVAAITLALAMSFGAAIMPKTWWAHYLAAGITIALGLVMLAKALKKGQNDSLDICRSDILFNFRIAPLGIIIKVLKDPQAVDCNQDASIGGTEALVLGLALCLDSIGGGFALGMAKLPILPTLGMVFLTNLVFLSLALWLGNKAGQWSRFLAGLKLKTELIPAIVLVCLGLWRLL